MAQMGLGFTATTPDQWAQGRISDSAKTSKKSDHEKLHKRIHSRSLSLISKPSQREKR